MNYVLIFYNFAGFETFSSETIMASADRNELVERVKTNSWHFLARDKEEHQSMLAASEDHYYITELEEEK